MYLWYICNESMKNKFISILFFSCFAVYSQTDTIPFAKKMLEQKYGFSIFGGLGIGGNDLSSNIWSGDYAKTISARFHYRTHTINAYATHVTPPEQPIFNRVSQPTDLNMHNFGLTYGIGAYGKHYSAGCLVGVAYTTMTTIFPNQVLADPSIPVSYRTCKYNVVNACFGLHASLKTKYIGIGYQIYYNLFGQFSSFNALLGLEVTLH